VSPGALAPALPPGFALVALEAVGSTNEEALRLAAEGAAAGTVVWAGEQLQGRGRRGRAWESPPGNLYCSVILRPQRRPAAQVSFIAALSLAECIASLEPSGSVRLKWPNDVLVGGGKVAGILLEGAAGGLVLGTGVNVLSAPQVPTATSLREQGIDVSVAEVLQRYLTQLAHWLARWEAEGFGPVRDTWLARAIGLGQSIEVRLPSETVPGVFAGLDRDGVLLLDTPSGVRRIAAGDVYVLGGSV
jgi:BirA family transcriptional regulator, biotin operon repressor / biotin---[acetyl-CoA-carboxylase] ligase